VCLRFSGQVPTQSTSNDFKHSIQANLTEQASTVQPGPLPNVDYDSDSSNCHGRTDSRSCLKFVDRDQPSHWPKSVDFLLGRTTAVISLLSLIFSTGIQKTLLEPVSLLCDRFILSKGPLKSLERDVIWRNRLGFANKLCSDSISELELRREHG